MKKLIFILLMLSSCATLMHGPNQIIPVTSNPLGAEIRLDDKVQGFTPTSIKLQRSHDYTLQIVLQGYLPYETKLIKEVDSWILGNLLFGGIPGLIIDAMTGSMYMFKEEEINVELKTK